MQPKQTSCGLYGIALFHTLFYQSLARGLCFFMKNSGWHWFSLMGTVLPFEIATYAI
jgi:hypothetical protein